MCGRHIYVYKVIYFCLSLANGTEMHYSVWIQTSSYAFCSSHFWLDLNLCILCIVRFLLFTFQVKSYFTLNLEFHHWSPYKCPPLHFSLACFSLICHHLARMFLFMIPKSRLLLASRTLLRQRINSNSSYIHKMLKMNVKNSKHSASHYYTHTYCSSM